MEAEYHRIIQNASVQSYIFPRPCISEIDSSKVCAVSVGWRYRDARLNRELGISLTSGYEFRSQASGVNAVDLGLLVDGISGPISVYLDARMFTEQFEGIGESHDRELVDRQDEETSGSIAYSSYSRYRSNLSYDLEWGRLTVAHDAVHW
ncbi:MAG: hypothetical protein M3Y08_20155, partial [Fibrobacterota bacterium]|nr:hypothetical protein [Fibrobacterota bacterium]